MFLLTIRRRRAAAIALLCSLLLLTTWPLHAVAQDAPQPATVLRNANLRTGPGTTYARAGSATAGATVQIVGQNEAGDWYELDGGQWIAAFLVTLEGAAPPAAAPPAGAVPAQVVSITDGDTIRVRLNGSVHPLRYILINTPETDEAFGADATAANRRLVEGQTVYLLKDVSETDRFNRLLRYVFLADGTHVNAELVRQGYAQVATFPPDVSREAEMRAAEAEARTAGRGLWAAQPAAGERSGEAVPVAPVQPASTPAPTGQGEAPAVALTILVNSGSNEVLELRNQGSGALDISGWRLDGSKGDDACIIPNGTTLAPGAGYQVATGDSQPQGAGLKCGDKPIWNNSGETIYLHSPSGLILSIESVRR